MTFLRSMTMFDQVYSEPKITSSQTFHPQVWAQVRPATFAWWKVIRSSSAAEGAPVGATSVQDYLDGSKWTVKLLEMSVRRKSCALFPAGPFS